MAHRCVQARFPFQCLCLMPQAIKTCGSFSRHAYHWCEGTVSHGACSSAANLPPFISTLQTMQSSLFNISQPFRWRRTLRHVATAARAKDMPSVSTLERQKPTPSEQNVSPKTVCVTGASGYLGTRVVERLLALGHTVHAVCMEHELQDPTCLAHITGLPNAAQRLRLFQGNILQPGSCVAALSDAQACIHLAAVVKLVASSAEQSAMVETALQGTRNVLADVCASPSVSHVIMSSSIAAVVGDNWERGRQHVFTEADWAVDCRVGHSTYNYSKMRSERLAYEVEAGQSHWSLTSLNPGVVFGPVSYAPHANTSPGMLLGILNGAPPALDLFTFFADVDDVAACCSSALALGPAATRGRHILVSQATSLHDIHDLCEQLLPSWTPAGKLQVPLWLLRAVPALLAPLTGTDAGLLTGCAGKHVQVDASHAQHVFGLSWIDWARTVKDTAQSLEQLGLLVSKGTHASRDVPHAHTSAQDKGNSYRETPM